MLLAFKFFRDLDKALGTLVGQLYEKINPGNKFTSALFAHDEIRKLIKADDEEFKTSNPELVQLVKVTCQTTGHDMPYLNEGHNSRHGDVLNLRSTLPETMDDKEIKTLVAHELAHVDTNDLSQALHKLSYAAFVLSCMSSGFQVSNAPSFIAFSALLCFVTGSYSRKEEFRCDEATLAIDPEGSMSHCDKIIKADLKKSFKSESLTSFMFGLCKLAGLLTEPILSHPSDWARKENLREVLREQEQGLPIQR